MSVREELDDVFAEIAVQLKSRVSALNGVKGLWQGTRAEFDAIPVKDDDVVYVVKPTPIP